MFCLVSFPSELTLAGDGASDALGVLGGPALKRSGKPWFIHSVRGSSSNAQISVSATEDKGTSWALETPSQAV